MSIPRLPAGHLRAFPVRYPPSFRREAAPPIEADGSVWIAFRDTTEDDRISPNAPAMCREEYRNRRREEAFRQECGISFHNGIDILGAEGLEVVSTTDGIVVDQWHLRGAHRGADVTSASGYIVVIQDTEGYVHHYAHLRDFPCPGRMIAAGARIGLLGRSGTAAMFGAHHLHYQVRGPVQARRTTDGTVRLDGQGGQVYNPFDELRRLATLTGIGGVEYQRNSSTKVFTRLAGGGWIVVFPPGHGAAPASIDTRTGAVNSSLRWPPGVVDETCPPAETAGAAVLGASSGARQRQSR